jgi:hypothetical protein
LNEYCIQIFLNFFFFRISDKKLIVNTTKWILPGECNNVNEIKWTHVNTTK